MNFTKVQHRVQCESWAQLLFLFIVGHNSVDEIEQYLLHSTLHVCAFATCASGLMKLTPGVNFINILVEPNGKVGRNFVGETELGPKNDYQRICALHHKVGEIDPWRK